MFDSAEGRKLASVDLPSYHTAGLGEDELAPYLDSFCLLQVSPDLGTAVAATQSNTAFAVDLNHYFRYFSSKQGRTITGTRQEGLLVIQSVQSTWMSHNCFFLDSLLPFSLPLSQKAFKENMLGSALGTFSFNVFLGGEERGHEPLREGKLRRVSDEPLLPLIDRSCCGFFLLSW